MKDTNNMPRKNICLKIVQLYIKYLHQAEGASKLNLITLHLRFLGGKSSRV